MASKGATRRGYRHGQCFSIGPCLEREQGRFGRSIYTLSIKWLRLLLLLVLVVAVLR